MQKISMRGGLPELFRQARRVQEKLEQMREEMKNHEETVVMADGKVAVTVSGERRVRRIKINWEELKNEDPTIIEDLIISAVNICLDKVDDVIKKETEKITGGVNLPGLF